MEICVYVVTDPPTREDLKRRLYEAMISEQNAELTLLPVDSAETTDEQHVAFIPLKGAYDGFGQHEFNGFIFEPSANPEEPPLRYIINITIPPWDGIAATAKIMYYPFESDTER